MKKFFSVGETAKAVNLTSETLRHYDRIGLIKPSHKDESNNYRYYTEQDIVRINTIRALQQMDLSLKKIKEILEYDDLKKIIDALLAAEKKADEKIALLYSSKAKIQLAKSDYETKLHNQHNTDGIIVKYFKQRVIMLSDTLQTPSINNLWSYLSHFYEKIEESQKEQFLFDDLAGIYTENELSRLFAVCISYAAVDGLKILPEGNYLCANCSEENRTFTLTELLQKANSEYHTQPTFSVQQIIVSGILQWNYQVQIYLGQ